MRTPHAQPDAASSAPPRRARPSTRAIVLAFAAIEAVLIAWALLSGRLH